MQLGCGNAMMSSDMYDAGWHYIDNIDISEVCIEQMTEMNKERRLMKWKVADALCMPEYRDETYDIVIEKSTLDAILCGDKSFLNAAKMLKEV
jgi:EEF1A lysine methyltransferase 4